MPIAEVLTDAGRRVIEAWSRFDRVEQELRQRYLGGPKVGIVEQEAFDAALAAEVQRRDAEISGIRAEANRQNAADEADIRRRLASDAGRPGDAATAAAWADRVKPRLDGGFPLSEVLEAPGLSRADIEAIRSRFPAYIEATVGPRAASSATTRESLAAAMRLVDAAELGLLDSDVRSAAIDGRQRDRAEVAMRRALAYDGQRRGGWKPTNPAQTEIELAYGLADDLGVRAHEPGHRDWHDITRDVDSEADAKRARNSLPADLRSALEGRPVGFRPAPEPSPAIPGGMGSESQS